MLNSPQPKKEKGGPSTPRARRFVPDTIPPRHHRPQIPADLLAPTLQLRMLSENPSIEDAFWKKVRVTSSPLVLVGLPLHAVDGTPRSSRMTTGGLQDTRVLSPGPF